MDKHLRSQTERIIGRMVEPQAILSVEWEQP